MSYGEYVSLIDDDGEKITTSNPLPTEVTGSTVDLRRKSADKPLATAVEVGTTFWSVDTDPHAKSIEVSDGTKWVVI
jgi:hypothetical protein